MGQTAFRCRDCSWFETAGPGFTRREATERAIAHYVETGHGIDATEGVGERLPDEPSPALEPDPRSAATRSDD